MGGFKNDVERCDGMKLWIKFVILWGIIIGGVVVPYLMFLVLK